MSTGTSQPSIVIDVQELVTHADSVATMERDMGNPPRVIRGQDVCYLFHASTRAIKRCCQASWTAGKPWGSRPKWS
jgi:hypothetical protein